MSRKLEITIPNDIKDITVGQYSEYVRLVKDLNDDYKLNEFLKIRIVSIFCNLPIELVREGFSADDVEDISTKIMGIITELADYKGVFEPTIEIGSTTFGFITDFENMAAGEFADLTSYFDSWDDAHKLAAVMFRPVKKTKYNPILKIDQYKIAKYNGTSEYAEVMKQFPVYKLIGANFTLSSSFKKLKSIFLISMEKKAKTELEKLKKTDPKKYKELSTLSIKSGIGTKAFTELLEVT